MAIATAKMGVLFFFGGSGAETGVDYAQLD